MPYGMYKDAHRGRRFLIVLVASSLFVFVMGYLMGRTNDLEGFLVLFALASGVMSYWIFRWLSP